MRQILHVDDFCNECGNCATFCVHQGKPYADKPRLFLEEPGFHLEDDSAFFIAGNTIHRREGGREALLTAENGGFTFENDHIHLDLSPEWQVRTMGLKEAFEGVLSLKKAAEMAVILRGVSASLTFLS